MSSSNARLDNDVNSGPGSRSKDSDGDERDVTFADKAKRTNVVFLTGRRGSRTDERPFVDRGFSDYILRISKPHTLQTKVCAKIVSKGSKF